MTKETRTLIEPIDVIAVEYECLRCHARISIPLEDYEQVDISCPQCRNGWVPSLGGPVHSVVHRVAKGIKDYLDTQNNADSKLGLRMRLQVREEKEV